MHFLQCVCVCNCVCVCVCVCVCAHARICGVITCRWDFAGKRLCLLCNCSQGYVLLWHARSLSHSLTHTHTHTHTHNETLVAFSLTAILLNLEGRFQVQKNKISKRLCYLWKKWPTAGQYSPKNNTNLYFAHWHSASVFIVLFLWEQWGNIWFSLNHCMKLRVTMWSILGIENLKTNWRDINLLCCQSRGFCLPIHLPEPQILWFLCPAWTWDINSRYSEYQEIKFYCKDGRY